MKIFENGVYRDMTTEEFADLMPSPDELAAAARAKRDNLLSDSDKYVCVDFPITDECRKAMYVYRQALRDIPEQEGFPQSITWPVMPEIVKAVPEPMDGACMLTEIGSAS